MSLATLQAPARPNALFVRTAALGTVVAYAVGWAVHYLYLAGSEHASHTADPRLANLTKQGIAALASHAGLTGRHAGGGSNETTTTHFLRDATLNVPVTLTVLLLAAMAVRAIAARKHRDNDGAAAKLGFAATAAVLAAATSIPTTALSAADQLLPTETGPHLAGVALATLRYTFAITLGATLLFGVPWKGMEETR